MPLVMVLAGADDPWSDAAGQDLHGYVRAVSLDVRGVVPSAAELEAIEAVGELDDTTLDAWLATPAFTEIVVGEHQERFWNTLSLTLLNARRLSRRSGIYYTSARARTLRGANQAHCGEAEAVVDGNNRPLSWQTNPDGTLAEGWVWVAPYWDPETPIQVCALDAQLSAVSTTGVDCATEAGQTDASCGCGPALQWCASNDVEDAIEAALAADIDHRVRALLDSGAPYTTLFSGDALYLNGASAHFFRHLAAFRTDDYDVPVDVSDIPALDYGDPSFVAVTLPEHRRGVLTAPGWLLRHQTNRGRANRFYGGFLCSEFLPTEGPVDPVAEGVLPTPNLQVRSGCRDCHARLEPWAAYWGRWAQAGSRHLAPDEFPELSAVCATCADSAEGCPDVCEDHYIVESSHPDEDPYVGVLRPYAFLVGDKGLHPDEGPQGWTDRMRADGTLATCAVTKTTDWLLDAEPRDDDIEDWAAAFDADEDYRALVRRVVRSASYWDGAE